MWTMERMLRSLAICKVIVIYDKAVLLSMDGLNYLLIKISGILLDFLCVA